MNCINCIWNWQFDENMQCKKANEKIRQCDRYKKVIKIKGDETNDKKRNNRINEKL